VYCIRSRCECQVRREDLGVDFRRAVRDVRFPDAVHPEGTEPTGPVVEVQNGCRVRVVRGEVLDVIVRAESLDDGEVAGGHAGGCRAISLAVLHRHPPGIQRGGERGPVVGVARVDRVEGEGEGEVHAGEVSGAHAYIVPRAPMECKPTTK
jgi:hypothetical protein